MRIKRFICFVLSLLLMLSFGRFSAFADIASKSNADFEGVGAKEFEYNFVPLKSTMTLRAASGFVSVSNTIDSTNVVMYCRSGVSDSTKIQGSSKHLGTNGSYSFVSSSSNIKSFVIAIPSNSMPTSGQYNFSFSFSSDFANEYSDIWVVGTKYGKNAAGGNNNLSQLDPDYIDTAGQFYRSPMLIDFNKLDYINIVCVLKTPVDAIGGNFHCRYEITEQTGGTNVGFSNSEATNTGLIAEATQELVSSQNETNGKLDDIIRHISDQLAAMWDQIYNLMAVPWIQNDNARTQRTINAIEDVNVTIDESIEEQNTVIEEQTEWHANFIIEGLKSLFIPSDTYFQTTINDLMTWFNDRLGFLGYTLTYLIRLLNGILNAPQNPVIRFPGIHAPNRATNEDYVLLPAMDVNLAEQISMISDGSFNLLEFLRTAGDIVLVLAFIVLLQDKLHEVEA